MPSTLFYLARQLHRRGVGIRWLPRNRSSIHLSYCSRTHKATDNQEEKKEKLHQQHLQQQRGDQREQRRKQEEDPGREPESVQSGTCKSRFPFRPEIPPLPLPGFSLGGGGRGAEHVEVSSSCECTPGRPGRGRGRPAGVGMGGRNSAIETFPCQPGIRKEY